MDAASVQTTHQDEEFQKEKETEERLACDLRWCRYYNLYPCQVALE